MTEDRLVFVKFSFLSVKFYAKIYIIRSRLPNSLPHYLVITKVKIFMEQEI